MLLAQTVCRADSRARAKTGRRIPVSSAISAMTTSNSISVKPQAVRDRTPQEGHCLAGGWALSIAGELHSCTEQVSLLRRTEWLDTHPVDAPGLLVRASR